MINEDPRDARSEEYTARPFSLPTRAPQKFQK